MLWRVHEPPPQTSVFAKFPHLPKTPTTPTNFFSICETRHPDGTTPTNPITADEKPQSRKTKKFNRHQSDRFSTSPKSNFLVSHTNPS
ncbi:hypothetical protein ANO14919_138930 [Xylariales sp. No.14919]|nr:hypothetical protein ANO14919_138930 [Xylariales sp. No.14919]